MTRAGGTVPVRHCYLAKRKSRAGGLYASHPDRKPGRRFQSVKLHPKGFPQTCGLSIVPASRQHFEKFGRTAYEFDFANPTPAEEPSPQFEAVKLFLEGKAVSPYARQQEAVEKREQATRVRFEAHRLAA